MSELTLAELREVQLDVLAQLDRLCRAQGLVYLLAYGTLLGAVRHGGFVPWDDDVDVMMPRADYERLLDSFETVAPAGLSLGSTRTQARWPLPYAKVSDRRTELHEPLEDPVELGVNIDVFPLDALPTSRAARAVQSTLLRFLRWALELHYIEAERGRGWHHPLVVVAVKPCLRLVPVEWLVRAFDRVARVPGHRPRARHGVLVGSFGWSVDRSSLLPPGEVAFEGLSCLGPADPDDVLRTVYGDYRQLPPEEERVSSHAFTARWRHPDETSRPGG